MRARCDSMCRTPSAASFGGASTSSGRSPTIANDALFPVPVVAAAAHSTSSWDEAFESAIRAEHRHQKDGPMSSLTDVPPLRDNATPSSGGGQTASTAEACSSVPIPLPASAVMMPLWGTTHTPESVSSSLSRHNRRPRFACSSGSQQESTGGASNPATGSAPLTSSTHSSLREASHNILVNASFGHGTGGASSFASSAVLTPPLQKLRALAAPCASTGKGTTSTATKSNSGQSDTQNVGVSVSPSASRGAAHHHLPRSGVADDDFLFELE